MFFFLQMESFSQMFFIGNMINCDFVDIISKLKFLLGFTITEALDFSQVNVSFER